MESTKKNQKLKCKNQNYKSKFKNGAKYHCGEKSGCEARSAEANSESGIASPRATGSAISTVCKLEIATPSLCLGSQ